MAANPKPQQTVLSPLNRVVHTSNSGIHIIREFYCEPYWAASQVIRELQGYVDADGVRHPPAADPWIDNCYCTECVVNFYDPDVITSADPIILNRAVTDGHGADDTLKSALENIPENPMTGTCGAKITAHYRPLITAYGFDSDKLNGKWDLMEPTYTPGVRQVPWPDGLYIAVGSLAGATLTNNVPDNIGTPLAVPVIDFSLRRILVSEIPWKAIHQCANGVNKEDWPGPADAMHGIVPTFPARTLKFLNPDITHMMDTEGNRWYEITLHWQAIDLYAEFLVDMELNVSAGHITWNHIFIQPWWAGQGPTGWYEVARGRQRQVGNAPAPFDVPGLGAVVGRLHHEVNFDVLF
jgi:hypothetical protein